MRGIYHHPRIFLAGALAFFSMAACTIPADAGPPRCFMHGMIVPKIENKEKTSLSDFLRLHFDVKSAEDKAKCEQFMESYCEHNVKRKGYSPQRLKGSFKPDVEKTEETTYKFTESCKLETD